VAFSAARENRQGQTGACLACVAYFQRLSVVAVEQKHVDGCGLLTGAGMSAGQQENDAASFQEQGSRH
jgi:hypothetical protein